jgi:nucleoid DNA-binding protein
MADRGLVEELVAGGLSNDEAIWASDKVLAAINARIRAGRTVQIDGIGRLSSRVARKDCYCDGPGKIEVKVACVKQPVEISRGEPWRVGKAT